MHDLAQELSKIRQHLLRSMEWMEEGQISTSSHGRDTTQETVTQFRIWISEINAVLSRVLPEE